MDKEGSANYLWWMEGGVKKNIPCCFLPWLLCFSLLSLSTICSEETLLLCFACEDGGVVDKTPYEAFTVKIVFKNTGKCEGTWSINVAFEGEV